MPNLNLRHVYKRLFSFFEPFSACSGYKISTKYFQGQNLFCLNSVGVSKHAEFYAEFKSVKKFQKQLTKNAVSQNRL
jgi:hypothetical protein